MTRQRSFKRLVRVRMEKTGESYTAARAALLGAAEPDADGRPALATSDEAIRARTGRSWEAWFDALDEWGAAERPHREIARWIAGQLELEPLAWNVQAVAVSFERVRGLRAVGERADGFAVGVSRTVAVPVERLYDAVVDEAWRARWLPDGRLRERTATRPRSARFDWGEDGSRVNVVFAPKGEARSTVTVEHARLADADESERRRAWWRERLSGLRTLLEGGAEAA
jgi:hypothetical protein